MSLRFPGRLAGGLDTKKDCYFLLVERVGAGSVRHPRSVRTVDT